MRRWIAIMGVAVLLAAAGVGWAGEKKVVRVWHTETEPQTVAVMQEIATEFEKLHPDVVIVDKIMPKMGGTRFMKRAQALDFSKDVLFVTVSSMISEPPHEHRHDVLGSKVHIPKTTRPIDIVILVEQLLTRKTAK